MNETDDDAQGDEELDDDAPTLRMRLEELPPAEGPKEN